MKINRACMAIALVILVVGCTLPPIEPSRYWLTCSLDGKVIVTSPKTNVMPYLSDVESGVWIFRREVDRGARVEVGSYRQRFGELCTVESEKLENSND